MAEQFKVSFLVNGSITQVLEIIDPAYTKEQVLEFLTSGDALTTIGSGDKFVCVVDASGIHNIAKVVSQSGNDDLEITVDSPDSFDEDDFDEFPHLRNRYGYDPDQY